MGSGEVAIVALSTMISLKVTFSDGLGGGKYSIVWIIIFFVVSSIYETRIIVIKILY